MELSAPQNPAPSADRLLAALRSGAWAEAEALLTSQADAAADRLLPLGDMLMRRRRWAEAGWVFDRAGELDDAAQMKRRLCHNLAALGRHRPAVYETLVALPAQHEFSVAATASGRRTVVRRGPGGAAVSLSPGPDPLAAAAGAMRQLYAATPGGEAVGLCGVGDGYLADALAKNPPALFMDKAQPVFLVEPEPHVLLQCLMIHDFTGPRGPIEQPRFYWFVGAGWETELEGVLLGDLLLPCPTVTVGQGCDAERVQARLRTLLQMLADRGADLAAEAERYYADVTPESLVELFGPRRSRRPRVLLLTTRFSTVLQFSTRDSAAAFERLGWDARVLIEPTPHHRVLRTAIREALAEFKPDLVFQIDHLRHEHDDLFPASLPFACWIQDHLPHLAGRETGSRVGPTDFVLTDATATYVDKFGYPARQCVALPKLTVASEVEPRAEAGAADDVVFVSNASQTPESMINSALASYGQTPATRTLIGECCGRMVAAYASGGSLPVYSDVCAVLRRTLADLGLSLPAEGFDVLARWLTHPFNDSLYRQQTLRWAAGATGETGLRLSLYGKDWESNPEFSRFARGPVAYGDTLAQLTRRSRINLQIVPYLCLHQRLLDGLMAGGFFLVRTHPSDVAPAALLHFLDRHVGASVRSTPAVAASLPPKVRPVLDALIARCRPCLCTTGNEDVVAMVRDWEDAGQLVAGEGPLPRLEEVSFHDGATLRQRFERFAGDPSLREETAGVQRRSVAGRLTYDAGLRRVVAKMRGLLSETAVADRRPPMVFAEPGVRAA